jgi:hypothetical protein
MPTTHFLEPTVRSLKNQTFQDFELVIVDSLHKYRPSLFEDNSFQGEKLPFPVKHVPPKPSPYMDKGMWHVCNNLNTAFIHAEGDLLIHFGDCGELLDPATLQKFWNWYERGYFASALVTYFHKSEPLTYTEIYKQISDTKNKTDWSYGQITEQLARIYKVCPSGLFKEGDVIRDSRWSAVNKAEKGILCNVPHEWWYGYTSVSMDAVLKVNGFDELMDGCKGLEDCDVGSRLQLAGYDDLVLDKNLTVIEHWHAPVSTKAVFYEGRGWKSNFLVWQLNRKHERFRANSTKLSSEDAEFIRKGSVGWDGVVQEDVNSPFFDWWVLNQPIFDLRELRLKL